MIDGFSTLQRNRFANSSPRSTTRADPFAALAQCGDRVSLRQDHDGPTHLIIGRQAPVEALQRAAHRLSIDARSLQRFQAEATHHG